MARPTLPRWAAGIEDWEALFNQILDILDAAPFGPFQAATTAALLALDPALYEDCFAVTDDLHEIWKSDGVAWRLIHGDSGQISANGARGTIKKATTELTLAGATTTWAGAFPAGVRQIGVTGRVTLLVTSGDGATGINVGDHGAADPDRYKANLAFALNGTFTGADATADPGGWNAGARDVVLSAIGGTFSGGKVRLVAFYIDCTVPTS